MVAGDPAAAVVLIGFLVKENLEHFAGRRHIPGLSPLLGQDHPFALAVLAAVTLAVAAVGALVRRRLRLLTARLAARPAAVRGPRPAARSVPARWWLAAAGCAHRWIRLRQDPGRSPPALRAFAPPI